MITEILDCEVCLKPQGLCICSEIRPIETRLQVLILQHPQEPDHELGTAKLTQLTLPKATLKIGLSWANLKAALGDKNAQPSRWVVLYLGSGIKGMPTSERLQFVSRQGQAVESPDSQEIEGIIILDGTWSQAKALWWRNAWLLKLKRAVLMPKQKSLYGVLRKEPRRECLSTLESVAECLDCLGEAPEVGERLRETFKSLLALKKKQLGSKN